MQWGQDLTISYFYAGLQAWLSVVLIIRWKLWVPLMRPIEWVFLVWALGWRLQQGWWGRWQQEWAGWYKWPPLHTACCSVKRSHVIFLHIFHKSVEIKHMKFWSSIWKQRFCSFYPNLSWVSNFLLLLPSCDPWPSLTSLPPQPPTSINPARPPLSPDQHQSPPDPAWPLPIRQRNDQAIPAALNHPRPKLQNPFSQKRCLLLTFPIRHNSHNFWQKSLNGRIVNKSKVWM